MANTVIAIKKSSTPSATPSSLANGELAINYADGKLFYKAANGSILAITSGTTSNAFSTVNANGTLILSDSPTGILTLLSANGITITGDAINDKVTIGYNVPAVNATSQSFNTNGTDTNFSLSANVLNQRNIIVSINGLLQIPTTHYTISGGTLSFTTAPIANSTVEARSIEGVVTSSGAISSSSNGSGLLLGALQSSSFTAESGYIYPINTTNNPVTVTLPANPVPGQQIVLTDYAGTFTSNNCIVYPNGKKISGLTSNVSLYTDREGAAIVYVDSTQGWLAYGNFIQSPIGSYRGTYLLVAGGGGAPAGVSGASESGGGGAGGMLAGNTTLSTGTTYTFNVGSGGSTGSNSGANTTGFGLTAIGGGYGTVIAIGGNGGSGGGTYGLAGGSGTTGQGNAGGTGQGNGGTPGGGGGAGAAGGSGASGGNGGIGLQSSITGTSTYYAGGGGGTSGNGGSGGGGNGGNVAPTGAGKSGTVNTGGGGGGGWSSGSTAGGAGGSGVAIVSVPSINYSGIITGSPNVSINGIYTVIKFTVSGTYTA